MSTRVIVCIGLIALGIIALVTVDSDTAIAAVKVLNATGIILGLIGAAALVKEV